MTEARLRQLTAVKFDALPLEQAIKIVRGNGSRKIAVFEDPNCGYCKRFERDLRGRERRHGLRLPVSRSSRPTRPRSPRRCGAPRTAARPGST